MTGVCAMCHKKFEKLVSFSEWRGNCRMDTLVCNDCRDKRSSNGGTCKSCVHYNAERMNSKYRGGCEKYHRYVEIADRCGQWGVKE